jgi:hypothetical protein
MIVIYSLLFFLGKENLVLEVPLQYKQDFLCDLDSLYKIPGSKREITAIKITSGGIYQYFSRPDDSTPVKPLEYPGPPSCLMAQEESRIMHIAQNGEEDSTLNVQTFHGTNTTVADVGPTTNATTTFISDAAVVTTGISHSKGPTLALAKKSQVRNVEDIKNFLAKPFRFATGIFQSTDGVSTFPNTWDVMYSILTNSMYSNKLTGFQGIRATAVFRIVLNANRFQQGRYMLLFVPSGGAITNGNKFNYAFDAHTNTLKQRTQCHRVEVDLNCDTEAELVIPFTSALNWFPLAVLSGNTTSAGEIGRVRLFPYVPLASSGGSTTAGWTIYAHLEDVELFGTTVPQMARKSRVYKRKSPSEIEAKNADIGPVESAMVMAGQVANALSVVPMLAPFAVPATWVADALAGVAASFGWSKPANLKPAMRMLQNYAPYMGNINNDDYSLPLSLDVSNAVEAFPGLGFTEADEMDFLSIASIPCWVDTYTFTTSNAVGDDLTVGKTTLRVTPSVGNNSGLTVAGSYMHFTPMGFVANFFNFWRGSIIFKIKIVKTEFHSGRISVTFTPQNGVGNTTSATFTNSGYLAKEVYDLRECNEIIFKVPYQSELPYLWNTGINTTFIGTKQYYAGVIKIFVEEILTAPATVPSTISLITEVYAGNDFEVAYSSPISLMPTYAITPQMGERTTRDDCRLDERELTFPSPQDQVEAASKCVGERVRSFRSLIKAYNMIAPTTAAEVTTNTFWKIYPFFCPVRWENVSPVTPAYSADLYTTLHGVFCYARGGVRLNFIPLDRPNTTDSARDDKIMVTRWIDNSNFSNFSEIINGGVGIFNTYASNGMKSVQRVSTGQPAQVSVPALGQTIARICTDFLLNSNVLLTSFISNYTVSNSDVVAFSTNSSATPITRNYSKFRAGADDCDFNYFISIMPMYYGAPPGNLN